MPEPFEYLWLAANLAVQRNLTVDQVVAGIGRGAFPGSDVMWSQWSEARLRRKLSRAMRKTLQRHREFTALALDVEAFPWPNARGRATDVAVMLALIRLARDSGEPSPMPTAEVSVLMVTAPRRQLAIAAGVGSLGTLDACLKRLDQLGLVHVHVPPGLFKQERVSTWTIRVPRTHSAPAVSLRTAPPIAWGSGGNDVGVSESVIGVPSLDERLHIVWTRAGLGVNARRVHSQLSAHGTASVADLVAELRLAESTVRALLESLAQHGLVEPEEGIWRACEADLMVLDEVATQLGVRAWRAQQEERTEAERAAFFAWKTQCLAERDRVAAERHASASVLLRPPVDGGSRVAA